MADRVRSYRDRMAKLPEFGPATSTSSSTTRKWSVASIRSGSGHKDIPADLIQLVTLYRRSWADVQAICGVTEQDIERAAALGPAVFAMLSRRDHTTEKPGADGSLRLRRAWTRLDRAYAQCRRAIAFLRFAEGDVDEIAPNLRRNAGPRGGRVTDTVQPTPAPAPSPTNGGGVAGGGIGGGGSPFVTPS